MPPLATSPLLPIIFFPHTVNRRDGRRASPFLAADEERKEKMRVIINGSSGLLVNRRLGTLQRALVNGGTRLFSWTGGLLRDNSYETRN